MKVFTLMLFFLLATTKSFQKSLNHHESRIIGGTTARAAQFPFAVAINGQTPNSKFFCGGTLIGKEWILTAGQCVHKATLFTISLGSNTLEGEDLNRITVSSSEYVVHPDFNPETLENDIGLIKLRMPVEYTAYLRNVNFLGSHVVGPLTRLIALGWGETAEASSALSNDLRWVNVAAISNDECRVSYGSQITNSTLCVEGNYNEGSCYGDTGSGVFQDVSINYKMIVGIASFVSGNGCESTDPSGYIRTFDYRTWIKEVTGI